MKFLTGDETGIIKVIRVESQKIERFGAQRRGDAVERLCWAGSETNREDRVAVAYASGALEARDSSGTVLSTVNVDQSIKGFEALGGDLLAISASGSAAVVSEWCSETCPEAGADDTVALRRFTLPGPISDAKVDPCRPDRLVFGGDDNDVKLWDLEKETVCWRGKNVTDNYLCLRVPVKVASLQWATRLAPSRSLVLCGTTDSKVRLYDCLSQRRPLFELVIGHGASGAVGSCGYTGAVDETPRPVTCSAIAQVRGEAWSLFVGNTMGVLREYDLRRLPACKSAAVAPGRKSHLKLADRSMPFKRGYGGIMGSIRAIDVHKNGNTLVAVGLGRFAYIYETRKRAMLSKVYLKQKLCSVLMSSEGKPSESKGEDDEGEEEEDNEPDEVADDESVVHEDDVKEGFSSDEDGELGVDNAGSDNAGLPEEDEQDHAAMTSKTRGKKRKRKSGASSSAATLNTDSAPESAGRAKKLKRRAKHP